MYEQTLSTEITHLPELLQVAELVLLAQERCDRHLVGGGLAFDTSRVVQFAEVFRRVSEERSTQGVYMGAARGHIS